MYVGNRVSDKLEPIHQRIYCQRSGTSSHTSAIARYVRYYMDIQASELGNLPPVESAATVMREIIYTNKNSLSAAMICSGWDPYKGYQIYQVNSSGYFETGNWALGGSGGTFVWGYVDANFKENMTRHEAKEFVKSCIALACFRDTSSGGVIRLIDISKDKVEREYVPYDDFKIK
jgi:20S proteasome subunit beta 1